MGVCAEACGCGAVYEYAKGEVDFSTWGFPAPIKDPAEVDWLARLLELEALVEAHGLPFGLIVNPHGGGIESDEAFHDRTLEFLRWYRDAGGSPQRYIIQSWSKHPQALGPEDQPHTLTNLVKAFIQAVKSE